MKLLKFQILMFLLKHDKGTMCKSQNFSFTQILREINFRDFRVKKSAILIHLEALIFDIYEFLHFLEVEIYQDTKIHSP